MGARHARRTPLLAALLTVASLFLATAPPVAATPTVAEKTQSHPYGPYNIYRFQWQTLCQEDHIQNPAYPVGDVGNAYEPAVSVGYRTAAQTCNDYDTSMVIRYYLYSSPDGNCSKNQYGWETVAAQNHTYSRVWTYHNIWINQWYWAGCRDTEHNRTRVMSRVMGFALGLEFHTNCWATYTVMTNRYCIGQDGAWPGTHDREGVLTKYSGS